MKKNVRNLEMNKVINRRRVRSIFLFSLFLVYVNLVSASTIIDTVFIDPTYKGTSKGTKLNPLTSIPSLESNTAYLIKGGTTLNTSDNYMYNVNNCILGSYGGVATINTSAVGYCFYFDGNGNVVENLILNVLNNGNQKFETSIGIEMGVRGGRCLMNNVHVTGGWRGLTGGNYYGGTGVIEINNCSVNTTLHDGMYFDDFDSIIVKNTKVWNVNLDWANDYGGDCLQTESVIYIVIDGCSFDHTTTKGKYCLITNGYINANVSNSTLRSYDGEACIYPGSNNIIGYEATFTIENSIIEGGLRNIQNRCDNLIVKGCLFSKSLTTAIDAGWVMNISNSTFINTDTAIMSWPTDSKTIVNCVFYNSSNPFIGNGMTGHNNLFYSSKVKANAQIKAFLGSDLIEKDPLFTNSSSDYSLQKGSPCIDAGDNTVGIATDIIGTKRPQGLKIDIGAYEYKDVSTPGTPTAFNVTGTSLICSDKSASIGLSNSEADVNYQLYKGTTAIGTVVTGTGSALVLSSVSEAGTYTVFGTHKTSGTQVQMTGSAIVSVQAYPTTYTITGGGTGCEGESFGINVANSQAGTSYQLYLNGAVSGSAITGTGSLLTFGNKTTSGTYTAKATINGCSQAMSGSAIITLKANPTQYSVTGGGNGCAGESFNVGIANSQASATYQLYVNGTTSGTSLSGTTGSALDFGKQTTQGTYTIKATLNSCTQTMTGSAVIALGTLPTTYSVTGGGTGCDGESFAVNVANSQTNTAYQLYFNGEVSGSAITGTGSLLAFGNKTAAGTYTVKASKSGCTQAMTGSAIITLKPNPVQYSVTGGGTGCDGESFNVGVTNSQSSTSYQLFLNGTASGSALAGTGSQLAFGTKTTSGTYTVKATLNGCTQTMTGSAVIVLGVLPTTYAVTGGGIGCEGEGFNIGMANSQSNASYQLYLNGTSNGSAVSGVTGSAIDFGKQTSQGNYTVKAVSSGCTQTMSGSATIVLNLNPSKYQITGGGTGCEGESFNVGVANSQNNTAYQLYLDGNTSGSAITGGDGQSLDFGKQTSQGTYTVKAIRNSCSQTMTGSAAIILNAYPVKYQVSEGGSYCSGDSGINISLSNSTNGAVYTLYLDAVSTNQNLQGTGTNLTFGKQSKVGLYTIGASKSNCISTMNGSAQVSINTLPQIFDVTGGGTYKQGEGGLPVGISNSESNVIYQLLLDGQVTSTSLDGTGSVVSFGNQIISGEYSVTAQNEKTQCTAKMSGSATIIIKSTVVISPDTIINIGTGTKSISQKTTIYPNPCSTSFNVKLENTLSEEGKIEIINLIGKRVAETQIASDQSVLEVPISLPSGTYFVRILEKNKVISLTKLVVK